MKKHFKFYFPNDKENVNLCNFTESADKNATKDKALVTCKNCLKMLKTGTIKYFSDKAGKEVKIKL